jgi:hypothetical protein
MILEEDIFSISSLQHSYKLDAASLTKSESWTLAKAVTSILFADSFGKSEE